jgi:integrase
MAQGSIEKHEGKQGVTWRLRYVVGYIEKGWPIQRRCTVKGTKWEAEAKLRELQTEVDKGTYIEPNKTTLAEFLRKWLPVCEPGLAKTTFHRYRAYVDQHIIPALGNVPLQKLTVLQVQEFANRLLERGNLGLGRCGKGCSVKSVRDCTCLLKQALDQAVEWEMLTRNPAKKIKIPRLVRHEPQILTEEQAMKVMDALRGTYLYMQALIAYHTGARLGEVLALTWDSINFDDGIVNIKRSYSMLDHDQPSFKEPKTKAGRRAVEVGPTLIKALRDHRKSQMQAKLSAGGRCQNKYNLICTTADGNFIKPTMLSSVFRMRTAALGFNVSFHKLRHTYISLLIKAGVPINVISERVGHANPSITHNVYSHLLPGMGRDAAERFEQLNVTSS